MSQRCRDGRRPEQALRKDIEDSLEVFNFDEWDEYSPLYYDHLDYVSWEDECFYEPDDDSSPHECYDRFDSLLDLAGVYGEGDYEGF